MSLVGEFNINTGSNPISDQLLIFLRIFSMKQCDLIHWQESTEIQELLNTSKSLSKDIEQRLKEYLKIRLHLLLNYYPTTIQVCTLTFYLYFELEISKLINFLFCTF